MEAARAPLSVSEDGNTITTTNPSGSNRSLNLVRRLYRHALHNVQTQWRILVFGQVLSFLLACTGAAQSTLALDCHLSAPTFSVGLFYFGLSFCLIPAYWEGQKLQLRDQEALTSSPLDTSNNSSSSNSISSSTSSSKTIIGARYSFFGGRLPLEGPPAIYFAMALLDVYANYFTVVAYKYTTITSVALFDALAIPASMILSRIFLSRTYSAAHFVGVLVCMAGIAFNILQDYEDDTTDDSELAAMFPHKLRGDTFAILAGIMFGADNVLAELAVRNLGGVYEYLGMMGFFATIICAIQTLLLERAEVAAFFGSHDGETCSEVEAWWLLAGFTLANILGYLGASRFLQISEATFFNLSLLTGDLWSVAFSIVVEHIVPHPLFYGALVFIVSGVLIYETAPTPVEEDRPMLRQRDWKETDDDEVIDFQNATACGDATTTTATSIASVATAHDLELQVHVPGSSIT